MQKDKTLVQTCKTLKTNIPNTSNNSPEDSVATARAMFMKYMEHAQAGDHEEAKKYVLYAVTMGCDEECPLAPKARIISWNIPDPKNLSDSELRDIRDEIERKVTELLKQIGIF